jgi:hypothetical protein
MFLLLQQRVLFNPFTNLGHGGLCFHRVWESGLKHPLRDSSWWRSFYFTTVVVNLYLIDFVLHDKEVYIFRT